MRIESQIARGARVPMRAAAGVLFVLGLGLSSGTLAQTQARPGHGADPGAPVMTMHKTTQLVVVDVVVTDKQGAPVTRLGKRDFHLFEGKVEQPLSGVEEHSGTAARPEAVTASPQPGTYINKQVNPQSGPLCVILMDSLNTALADQAYAHSEMLKLAQSLPTGSRVAVFRLGSKLSMLQGFTEDSAGLIETLNDKKAGPQLGPFFDDADLQLALNQPDLTAGMGGGQGSSGHVMAINDPHADELKSDLVVSMTLRSLRALGLYLSALPGRKNLVWLAGSFPIDILPSLQIAPDTFAEADHRTYMGAVRDLALLLQSGNIVVYPVDVRGVVDSGLFNAAGSGSAMAGPDIQSATRALTDSLESNAQIRTTMQTMAELTGGRAFFNTNDITASVVQAFNDGSNYYSLSYVPLNHKWDGKFRKLTVRVDGRDLRLYYRQGYYAEDPDKPRNGYPSPDPAIGAAMVRGMPETSQLKFQLQLKPAGAVRTITPPAPSLQTRGAAGKPLLNGPAQRYSVIYSVNPSDIGFSSEGVDQLRSDLAFSAIAYDAQGKMLNSNVGVFNAPISRQAYAAMTRDALHIRTAMDLPTGRVYLRVGVRDRSNGKIGTMEIPVDVGTQAEPRP